MVMTRKYEGTKLVKKTFYMEESDVNIFEMYAKQENKKFSDVIRKMMSMYSSALKKQIK